VYKVLKQQIGSGHFRPGERIYEKVLVQRLNISRTPIREALLKLERDGLVICNSRRSYNVRRLTVADVKEIYQVLGMLEGSVAGLVAGQITPDDLELLRRYNARMESASSEGNLPAFGAWNRKFHDVFLSKLGNRTLCELCDSVRQQLYNFPVSRASLKEWIKKSVLEHTEIIRLAETQDRKGLEEYFRHTHWSEQKNLGYIEKAYDRDGDAAVPA
jgi:DNA-binding GntR family transcriptional regulator